MAAYQNAHEAISDLFDSYGNVVYTLGLRMCGDPERAADVVQDTFMNAFRAWDKFEGRADPRTWIYAIATRACRRMQRRRAGEPQHMASIDELLPSIEEGIVDVDLSRGRDPHGELMRREAREVVDRALPEIPAPLRLVLILKEIAELPMSEIATILGIKEATVRTRLHRARLYLRKAIAETLPSRDAPHPDHPREVCLTLLQAKQEALDRGAPFNVPGEELCRRCRALFKTLDLAHEACIGIRHGNLPPQVRRLLDEKFGSVENPPKRSDRN